MLYAVIPLGENARLPERLSALSTVIYEETAPNVYFLSYPGTANSLSSKLGFGEQGGGGEGIVLRVSHHAGYTYRSLWDWLMENED